MSTARTAEDKLEAAEQSANPFRGTCAQISLSDAVYGRIANAGGAGAVQHTGITKPYTRNKRVFRAIKPGYTDAAALRLIDVLVDIVGASQAIAMGRGRARITHHHVRAALNYRGRNPALGASLFSARRRAAAEAKAAAKAAVKVAVD